MYLPKFMFTPTVVEHRKQERVEKEETQTLKGYSPTSAQLKNSDYGFSNFDTNCTYTKRGIRKNDNYYSPLKLIRKEKE